MTGYIRKDTTNNIADGNIINATDLDNEFDGVQAAFVVATGHTHDGTASEGAAITKIGPVQDVVVSIAAMYPKTTNTIDLGTSSLKYKDAFFAGNETVGGTLAVTGVTTLTAQPVLSSLTASQAVFTNGTKGLVSNAITGTGNVVMSTSPTLVTPALGTPASGIVTNLTGTASININGTVGATTPAAGSFTNITGSANAIISVTDNTNAALRITQLGTGNALLVEDETNPDASPFVINSNGIVIQGNTTAISIAGTTATIQQHGVTSQTSSIGSVRWQTASAAGPQYIFGKSRSGIVGSYSVVSSGDNIGTVAFTADDGAAFVQAATISASVDGTPGTNDMPGRLVFSTTPDGSATPTERMRINSAGSVGIGGTSIAAGYTLSITRAMTGAVTAYGVIEQGAIQTDVTAAARYFSSFANGAASLTTSALSHFYAQSGSLGAGSAVTSQYGFVADSSLTGATNNYGFYSNIASGTNRYNFYANGTATNFFAGNTIISVTDNTNAALRITQLGTGNALLVEDSGNPDSTPVVIDASGNIIQGYTSQITSGSSQRNIQSVGTSNNTGFSGIDYTNDATTNALLGLFKSRGGTINTYTTVNSGDRLGIINWGGADGTAFVNAARIEAYVDATPGLNDMPGRLVFSTTPDGAAVPVERMRIDSAGNVGIGTTSPTSTLSVTGTANITGNVTLGDASTDTVTVAGTTNLGAVVTTGLGVTTGAASFELGASRTGDGNTFIDFHAASGTDNEFRIIRAGGIDGNVNLTNSGAGTFSLQQSGAGNILFQLNGGNVGIGTTTPASRLSSTGSSATDFKALTLRNSNLTTGSAAVLNFETSGGTEGDITSSAAQIKGVRTGAGVSGALAFWTSASGVSAERMRITNAGNIGIGTTNPLVKLEVEGSTGTAGTSTASIAGTTMTVTAVANGTFVVGDLIYGANIQPYTRITAFGTGTGGVGTYTVSVSQTVASTQVTRNDDYGGTVIRITNLDVTETTGQPTGGLQFYTSDISAPTAGVGAYVAAMAESATPDTALVFGTRNDTGGGIDANERMRLDSSGNLGIGTTSPSASAILDAQSTTKGVRMPNMTTTQKNAIATPAAGLMVFDTTLAKLCVYTGAAWQTITSA